MYIGLSVECRPIVQSGAQLNQISVGDFMEDPETPKVFYHYFNTLTFCLVVHAVLKGSFCVYS